MQELSLSGSQKKKKDNPKMRLDAAVEKRDCIPNGLIECKVKHGDN